LPVVFRCSSQRERRRLTRIELHVEDSEKRCCPGIIAHQRDKIDQRPAAELAFRKLISDMTREIPILFGSLHVAALAHTLRV
jgi:hypothetical protein